ncbi:YhgE/Pip domain-containing protein [Paenibacillus koleovorans]|uniref:YhgE/Pip domain-containing protein n=1 Tax=Paenibacillus koleovorans TaxID=121608 RepID=UPI000FDCBF7D|nr:DUF3533 domain-containing protein [Paenibacillus koleovorans]
MNILKQKQFYLGIVVALVVLSVFGLAMMGSIAGAKPKNLPVALVVQDEPAAIPGGGTLAVGEMIKTKLGEEKQLPISWKTVASEAEARAGLDRQEYYGALVLPANLSSGVLSAQSSAPKPPTVLILVNEGMSAQASGAVSQMLQQAMGGVRTALSQQLLGTIGKTAQQIPVQTATALLAPLQVQVEAVHPVGANQASGNAPGMLTQIGWIGSLVSCVFLFLATNQAVTRGGSRLSAVALQTVGGVVIAALLSGFIIWMASGWYSMELADATGTWLFLWFVMSLFFLLQSTLLQWIGLPAMAILVLLMFFSMPLLNMAPEFLPQATQDWLYSWTPLRYAAGGLRNAMYFGGVEAASASTGAVLWSLAIVCLLGVLASGFKRRPARGPVANSDSH